MNREPNKTSFSLNWWCSVFPTTADALPNDWGWSTSIWKWPGLGTRRHEASHFFCPGELRFLTVKMQRNHQVCPFSLLPQKRGREQFGISF